MTEHNSTPLNNRDYIENYNFYLDFKNHGSFDDEDVRDIAGAQRIEHDGDTLTITRPQRFEGPLLRSFAKAGHRLDIYCYQRANSEMYPVPVRRYCVSYKDYSDSIIDLNATGNNFNFDVLTLKEVEIDIEDLHYPANADLFPEYLQEILKAYEEARILKAHGEAQFNTGLNSTDYLHKR